MEWKPFWSLVYKGELSKAGFFVCLGCVSGGEIALSRGAAGYGGRSRVVMGLFGRHGCVGGCPMPVLFWQKDIHGGYRSFFDVGRRWKGNVFSGVPAGGDRLFRVPYPLLGSRSPGLILQQFLVVLPWVALTWTVSGSMRHCLSRFAMSVRLILVPASNSTCLLKGSRKK